MEQSFKEAVSLFASGRGMVPDWNKNNCGGVFGERPQVQLYKVCVCVRAGGLVLATLACHLYLYTP